MDNSEAIVAEKEVLGEEVAPDAQGLAPESGAPQDETGSDRTEGDGRVANDAPGGGAPKRKRPRRRQRHRRGGRERNSHGNQLQHKWKPYDKLTWAERHALEERETERALRVREERFANGHPVAPYNTTQFLMDDHINSSAHPKLSPALARKQKGPRERHASAPGGDAATKEGEEVSSPGGDHSDDANSSDYDFEDDEDMDSAFLAKEEEEFSQTYDTIHAESLHNMTKNQLVLEYMELEARLEDMTKKIQREDPCWTCQKPSLRPLHINAGLPTFIYEDSNPATNTCCHEDSDEIRRLKEKVEGLEKENQRIRSEMQHLQVSVPGATASTQDRGGGMSLATES